MIPPIDTLSGYLPYSSEEPIWCTLEEIRATFVPQGNARRAMLWEHFGWWLRALNEAQIPGSLRLGGSFFSHKIEPNDIDVAVAIDLADEAVADKLVKDHPHLWTWQNVGTFRQQLVAPGQFQPLFDFVAERVQPALGKIDAHKFLTGTPGDALFAGYWTSEYVSHAPTGVRKGWLGVMR